MNASKCPACGNTFAAVRCPKCSYIGQSAEFAKGCPNCGFTEEPDSSKEGPDHEPRRTSSRGLSSAFYGLIGIILIAAVIILIILYSRIF